MGEMILGPYIQGVKVPLERACHSRLPIKDPLPLKMSMAGQPVLQVPAHSFARLDSLFLNYRTILHTNWSTSARNKSLP